MQGQKNYCFCSAFTKYLLMFSFRMSHPFFELFSRTFSSNFSSNHIKHYNTVQIFDGCKRIQSFMNFEMSQYFHKIKFPASCRVKCTTKHVTGKLGKVAVMYVSILQYALPIICSGIRFMVLSQSLGKSPSVQPLPSIYLAPHSRVTNVSHVM